MSKQSNKERSLEDIINSKKQYEENMEEYKLALETHMQTKMFKPETGRPPKERPAEKIYDHLIKVGTETRKKQELKRTEEFEKFRDNNPDVDTWSVQMFEEKKLKILDELFD